MEFEYLDLGSHGNKKYSFSMRQKSWVDAEAACKAKGGHVAVTKTPAETTALNALLDQAPKYTQKSDIFLGAKTDNHINGRTASPPAWGFWADGSELLRTDSRWGWMGPKAYGQGPPCLVMRPWQTGTGLNAKNGWALTRCSFRQYFICQV